jgi:acetolactate synthase I/II/III large subunit
MWTTRHGRLIGPDARVAQVDVDPDALGKHRPIQLGVVGDSAATAAAVGDALGDRDGLGYRDDALRSRIARELRWRDVPYDDWAATTRSTRGH